MTHHRAKKRFGQNFLRDRQVVDQIIAAAELSSADRVMEIGPGLGVLTDRLLKTAGRVLIIEIDRDLVGNWEQRNEPNLQIVSGDVLALDWAELLTGTGWKLVANLPYNISSQVVFRIIEQRNRFCRLVLMFQKEVGDRLCAGPGSRDYGALSIFSQLWFDIERVVKVPPQAFTPAPKVDSVVLKFTPLPQARVAIGDERQFKRVVKSAFAQRRKTLRNTLKTGGFSSVEIATALEKVAIDPGRRAETLSLAEFARLADQLPGATD
ncbi:MAG TPA: 16S rRNA (adenine(1518)-N(6)/adenine(1519)-N(6))-dimethyltransferase RsmA [Geothermobacteraceae bacterium]|nr:16S rRNA (adenine(1518)-N(6)/adenine(1519)-N(6))-dimethyltransferase RsmA [Geothermobacteraceae bacterium]